MRVWYDHKESYKNTLSLISQELGSIVAYKNERKRFECYHVVFIHNLPHSRKRFAHCRHSFKSTTRKGTIYYKLGQNFTSKATRYPKIFRNSAQKDGQAIKGEVSTQCLLVRENFPYRLGKILLIKDLRLIIPSTLQLDMLVKFMLDIKEFVDAVREHMNQFDGTVPWPSK